MIHDSNRKRREWNEGFRGKSFRYTIRVCYRLFEKCRNRKPSVRMLRVNVKICTKFTRFHVFKVVRIRFTPPKFRAFPRFVNFWVIPKTFQNRAYFRRPRNRANS